MEKYYIVEREYLGYLGDERGVETLEEAQRLLDASERIGQVDVVVIKGRELKKVITEEVVEDGQ